MELIETSTFTKQITTLLRDEEYGEFQSRLAANPELGAVIKGGGGIRKVRVALGSRGKSGGARVNLLLGCTPGCDSVALRVSQERHGGSDSEAACTTGQSCQRGILQ